MRRLGRSVFFLLLFIPVFAHGHVYMLESFPPENAVLYESPEKVSLTFVGSVEPMFSTIEVFNSNGMKVSKKSICKEDDTIMEAELEKDLPSGEYTVKWKCMSLDGHKQTGEFKFKIDRNK